MPEEGAEALGESDRRKREQNRVHIANPAHWLWALREGHFSTIEGAARYFGCHPATPQNFGRGVQTLISLEDAGLVTTSRNEQSFGWGRVSPIDFSIKLSVQTTKVLRIFNISLTSLAFSDIRSNSILISPSFYPTSLPPEHYRCDVFCVMPFQEPFNTIFRDHVQKITMRNRLICKRGDDVFSSEDVVNEVYAFLLNARLVLADCTQRNANVFYEIGMAHVMGKRVIAITQEMKDIPFDLAHRRSLKYTYTPEGMTAFEKILERAINMHLHGGVSSASL